MPCVSVIVPTYNRAHSVGRALRSVLAQTFQDFEVIVVDDASTDNTEEVIRGFQDARIHFVRHESNRGAAAARNTGIQTATGDFIAYQDSDDEWLPEKLEKQVHRFATSDLSHVGVVRTGGFWVRRGPGPTVRGWLYEELLARRIVLVGSVLLMVRRTRQLSEILWDETLPSDQDWDYLLRLSAHCQIDTVPEALVRIHRDPEPRVSTLDNQLASCRLLLRKYGPELRLRPRALARHLVHLAVLSHKAGDSAGTVRYLYQAIQAYPQDINQYVWLLGALLGPPGFKTSLKLIPWRKNDAL